MNFWVDQDGISLIVVIVAMLIFATLGVLVTSLVSSDSDVALNQSQSEQAFYLAEAGKEYAIKRVNDGTSLSNCPIEDVVTVATGQTFYICRFPDDPLPGQTRITSRGEVTSPIVTTIQRQTETIVGGGEMITNGGFDTNLSNWTANDSGSGSTSWDGTMGNPLPGSLLAKTSDCAGSACRNLQFSGYRSQSISLGAGQNATLQFRYCKTATGATSGGSRMDVSVVTLEQGGATVQVWPVPPPPQPEGSQPNTNCSVPGNWTLVNITFTPANPVTEIRLVYNLRNPGGNPGNDTQKKVWFDTVSLTGGLAVLSWNEIYN